MLTYGKLIYALYGARAEAAFLRSWGVGLAMENALQFRDILAEVRGLAAAAPTPTARDPKRAETSA